MPFTSSIPPSLASAVKGLLVRADQFETAGLYIVNEYNIE